MPIPGAGVATSPLGVLKDVFGYSSFRKCQEAAIRGVLAGRDELVVMATGGGKSLCYQVPPLVMGKPALIISPLISLMQDQVMALNAKGVSACYLGSAQTDAQVVAGAWAGEYQFIYATPELAVNRVEALCRLRDSAGLALVAVDEAHCVAEWGYDFRPEYRQLGALRDRLQGVPFLALTATATPQVRRDIVANLRLRPGAELWVESFERHNLSFEVRKKAPTLAASFQFLVDQFAQEVEPTIVYTVSKREAVEVAAALQALPSLAGKVGVYHAGMPLPDRTRVHSDFLRDKLAVVCCTLAFGMGVDKGNVRNVVHYGMPSSLEAYYQQAGRAGRDGIPARCTLLWSQADAATHASIKNAGSMDARAAETFQAGISSMMDYCTAPGCRHAAMVDHFDPGTFRPAGALPGTCAGGCDNCTARASGRDVRRDVQREAALLLAVLDQMAGYFGLGKALKVLRGSKASDVKPQWLTMRGPDGTLLHGSGHGHSEEWWKGLTEICMAQGLVKMEMRHGAGGGRGYTVVVLSPPGRRFLQAPGPLEAPLTQGMLAADRVQAAAQAAVQAAAQQRLEVQTARQAEEQKLERRLREVRAQLAAAADLAPENVVGDAALREIARVRPDSAPHLRSCEGCGAAFIERYGRDFVAAVVEFCRGSGTLTAGVQWKSARSGEGGAQKVAAPPAAGLLSEPKGAATEALTRFCNGQSLATIATTGRPKPINPMSVAGYLADAAGAGAALDWPRLVEECALTQERALTLAAAITEYGALGVGAVKRSQPPEYEYGQIKVVAAMMLHGGMWFGADSAEQPTAAHVDGAAIKQPACAQREPAAKRARTGDENADPDEATTETPAAIDAGAVLGWLETNGPTSGAALARRFCRTANPEAQRRLSSVLRRLVQEFAVCRKGGAAAASSAVDLQDGCTLYMLL